MKICGITRAEDALAAVEAGARYLGFIFAESPRRVSPETVRDIAASVPAGIELVGVFVDETAPRMERFAADAGLTMVQLHGNEPPDLAASIDLPVIKAMRLRRDDEKGLRAAATYPADYLLIEPYVEGKYGGTGRVADWALAGELVASHPERRFFLAGGLGPHNVAEAIRTVRPYAVDASSGLEARPGVKDPRKIRAFSEVVKSL